MYHCSMLSCMGTSFFEIKTNLTDSCEVVRPLETQTGPLDSPLMLLQSLSGLYGYKNTPHELIKRGIRKSSDFFPRFRKRYYRKI